MDKPWISDWLAKSTKEQYLNSHNELKFVRVIIEPMPERKYLSGVQMMYYDQTKQAMSYKIVSSNALCESYEDALKYCTETIMPVLKQKLESGDFDNYSVHKISLWFRRNGYCTYAKQEGN